MSKKANDILKGVAGVGAVIGGASIIGDADVVYAAELDQESTSTVTELEVSASESTVASEYVEEPAVYGGKARWGWGDIGNIIGGIGDAIGGDAGDIIG